MKNKGVIASLSLDDPNVGKRPAHVDYERDVAIREILEENVFCPVDDDGGPYDVSISLQDGRLVLDVMNSLGVSLPSLVLSLRPYRRVVKDYFMIVSSYEQARAQGNMVKLEAIDMGRRGVHDEGADLFMERLSDKVSIDHATARRFFTLICVMHFGQVRSPINVGGF